VTAASSDSRFNPFGEFAQGAAAGSVSDLMSNSDHDRDRPLDDCADRHECEPRVPGEARIDRVRGGGGGGGLGTRSGPRPLRSFVASEMALLRHSG
jgi:hypothetical protein